MIVSLLSEEWEAISRHRHKAWAWDIPMFRDGLSCSMMVGVLLANEGIRKVMILYWFFCVI